MYFLNIYITIKKHIEFYTVFEITWILDINLTLYLMLFNK